MTGRRGPWLEFTLDGICKTSSNRCHVETQRDTCLPQLIITLLTIQRALEIAYERFSISRKGSIRIQGGSDSSWKLQIPKHSPATTRHAFTLCRDFTFLREKFEGRTNLRAVEKLGLIRHRWVYTHGDRDRRTAPHNWNFRAVSLIPSVGGYSC